MTTTNKLQSIVSALLSESLGGCVVYTTRLQSGKARRGRYTLVLCPKGTPDNMAVLANGQTAFLEVKDTGDKPSIEQRHTMMALGAVGVPVAFVVRDDDQEIARLGAYIHKWRMFGVSVVPVKDLMNWLALKGGYHESDQTSDD